MTSSTGSGPRRRISGIADGLTKEDIRRAADEWHRIGRLQFLSAFGGTSAQRYVVLDDNDEEMDALALLRGARTLAGLDIALAYRGDRANVAEPLRQLGFFVEDRTSETECPVGTDPMNLRKWVEFFSGPTDDWSLRMIRREQGILRGALGIGTGDGTRLHPCGLCGRELPERLLIAAHVKPRSNCSEAERVDIPSVVMIACSLGCDALYEHGYISVGKEGTILASCEGGVDLSAYRGRHAPAWRTDRDKYFEWHRENRFGRLQ